MPVAENVIPAAPGAHLRLVSGSSNVIQRALSGMRPRWLRVGSDPNSDWRVHAEGVAPEHCELLWDGHGLFVQDRLRLGGTYAGKRRVAEWTSLPRHSVLRLGAAAMWIEGPAEPPSEPATEALRWVQQQAEELFGKRRSSAPPATAPDQEDHTDRRLWAAWWLTGLGWLERMG